MLYPLAAVPIQRIGKRVRRASGGMQERMGETAALLNESFAQARTVRAYRLEAMETQRAEGAFAELYRALLRMARSRARIDPLLSQVDASLAASGPVGALAQTLAAHMKHEEDQALPLVEAHLGPDGWAAFRKATGKIQGLRGGAEFFPWMLDGASADTSKKVLGMLPPPARLLYWAVWRPRYARTPRWDTTTTRTTAVSPPR